eukprot:14338400-Ditylum_brightwellii.AAC.1
MGGHFARKALSQQSTGDQGVGILQGKPCPTTPPRPPGQRHRTPHKTIHLVIEGQALCKESPAP